MNAATTMQTDNPFAGVDIAPARSGSGRGMAIALLIGMLFILLSAGGAAGMIFLLNQEDTATAEKKNKSALVAQIDDKDSSNDQKQEIPAKKDANTNPIQPAPKPAVNQPAIKPFPAPAPKPEPPPAPAAAPKPKSPPKNTSPQPQPKAPAPVVKRRNDDFYKVRKIKKKRQANANNGDAYRTNLTNENQERVNNAVALGVKYLRGVQLKDGKWLDGKYAIGYTSLAALTLLECGAEPTDPQIKKAAMFVRFNSHTLKHTYQISLAILFLDRLGDKGDRKLIRRLALRLVAGQTAAGGWNYPCPLLNSREEFELITFLQRTRPLPIPIAKNNPSKEIPIGGSQKDLPIPVGKDGAKLPTPIGKGGGGRLSPPVNGTTNDKSSGGGLLLPFTDLDKKRAEEAAKKKKQKPPVKVAKNNPVPPRLQPAQFPKHLLSKKVQKLPIVEQQPLPRMGWKRPQNRGRRQQLKGGRDDNSNTQFAMLALWAARRYGVPVERTLALVDERFETSQNPSGGWAYMYMNPKSTPQMTCVGLIGLAIGHGAYKETYGNAWKGKNEKVVRQDPQIQDGLRFLGTRVGDAPMDWNQRTRQQNLYYLWSLERTAMLYNLRTVGGKDWYSWAAQMLTSNQQNDGSWTGGAYHGSSPTLDTCMALLILRRANLTEDLSRDLQMYIPIRDPGANP